MPENATFFGLPLELRCEIYRYLLVGVHEVRTFPKKAPQNSPTRTAIVLRYARGMVIEESWDARIKRDHEERKVIHSASRPEYAVLRVSQRTYQEASAILYTESKFWVSYETGVLDREGFSGIGDLVQNLHRVCHLGIDIHHGPHRGCNGQPTVRLISQILAYYFSGTGSLRSLEISLELQDERDGFSSMIDRFLQEKDIQKLVSNFKVKEKIEIRTGIYSTPQSQTWSGLIAQAMDASPHAARAQEWCCRVAEDKNWDLHLLRESNVNLDASLWQSWVLKPKHDEI